MNGKNKFICSVMAIIALVTGGTLSSDKLQPDAVAVGLVQIGDVVVGELLVSANALKIIGNAEGCRRAPYKCPAGLATDGIGNTHAVNGDVKSNEQIAIDWTRNIIAAQNCLTASAADVEMTQGQIDAFTSFIFNTGCTVFRHNRDGSETRIFKKIKRGDYQSACHELNYWVYAGGHKLPGLVTRRRTETEVCLAE